MAKDKWEETEAVQASTEALTEPVQPMREFKSHKPAAVGAKLSGARARPAAADREKLEWAAEAARQEQVRPAEIGGPEGPEPTRYGDWERKGICVDF